LADEQLPDSAELVEKEINGGNLAIPRNDEIRPCVGWGITGAARYRLDAPGIAQFLGFANWLISKAWMSGFDRAGDPIDLVAAHGRRVPPIVEHAIFREDLVNRCARSFSPKTSRRLRINGDML